MQQNILQSVLKITGQRDIDSLEHNLPASIAALLPVQSISIYKPVMESDYQEVEEIVKFLVQDTSPNYLWSEKSIVLNANKLLQECFCSAKIKESSSLNGTSEIYFPIDIDGKTLAALRVASTTTLDEAQRQILDALTEVYRNYLTILNENERDQLTSLLNRRSFDQRFDKLISIQKHQQLASLADYSQPEKRQLADSDKIFLATLDIDFFKRVNNEFGHACGDEILLQIANLMRESFRSTDLLFRFGGEEFIILLEPTSSANAYQTLERFRKKIEEYNFPQLAYKLTVSIGYTAVIEQNNSESTVARADQALAYGKKHGRNCTINFEKI
ncbi:GGDEF domain-containing protein [Gammaproteobacteria bacterium]|nr:GGDEF domain-containing protein [Gammaproteobacteria bacterium]